MVQGAETADVGEQLEALFALPASFDALVA